VGRSCGRYLVLLVVMTNPDVAKKGSKLEGAGGCIYIRKLLPHEAARQPRGRSLVQILEPLARSAPRAGQSRQC